jgi:hypothetical protein
VQHREPIGPAYEGQTVALGKRFEEGLCPNVLVDVNLHVHP